MTAKDARSQSPVGARIAAALLVAIGLVVAAGGIGIVTDGCQVACGTVADQQLRDGLGYAEIVLGASAAVLAIIGQRWIALGAAGLGATCGLIALMEGLSHLR